ncbi:MAG TPA: FxDxF family PEP-CTERM protein [Cellvibrionaceae bacterium]
MPIKLASHLRRLTTPCLIAMSVLFTQTAAAETIDLGDYAAPDALAYGNSFSAPLTEFTDWYSFSVGDAVYNGITASISFQQTFGIEQVTSALYSGTITGDQVNVGSLIATGNTTIPWLNNYDATQTTSAIDPVYISGDYLIKISGVVTGAHGGSYVGLSNLAPVPLPPTLPLMAAGVGLLALIRRNRSTT